MRLRFPPTRYRVARDQWLGYEAQFKPWWSPLWKPCERDGGGVECNSNHTIESARQLCANHAKHRRRHPAGQVVARFSARELEAQQ